MLEKILFFSFGAHLLEGLDEILAHFAPALPARGRAAQHQQQYCERRYSKAEVSSHGPSNPLVQFEVPRHFRNAWRIYRENRPMSSLHAQFENIWCAGFSLRLIDQSNQSTGRAARATRAHTINRTSYFCREVTVRFRAFETASS